jgi:DNA-binding transcriptional regulator YiaG
VEPSQFPEDFPQRLERLKDATGFSWRGLARRLRVSAKCVRRWKTGMQPSPGHLFSLFTTAEEMGLLHILLHGAGEPGEAGRLTG